MSIECDKPTGCKAVAMEYGLSYSDQLNVTAVCGDRRTDLQGVSDTDNRVDLARDLILGMCVSCPNRSYLQRDEF